jgi:CheY-like chemotaxis protein
MNLLGNAIKFTHEGEVSITSLLTIKGSDLEFSCNISDTGIGIPLSKLSSLFNSFTQADTSTTREYGGTGLGLAISKKLAILMGGNILACSEEGQGSEFKVNLSFKQSDSMKILKPKSNIMGQQFLIIDSNKSTRELLKKQIEIWQGVVYLSKNILSAKSVLMDNKIDFVLIDCHSLIDSLSNDLTNNLSINAIENANTIRAYNNHRPIKIILMAPMNLNSTKEMRMMFDLIIPKPISTFDFLNFIDSSFEEESNQLTPLIKNVDESISVQSVKTAWPENCRILLVEDILFNQEVAIMMLEEIGLNADIANNGKQALSKLKADPSYSLVLMDCQMPEMDGFDTTKAIRSGECGEHYRKLNIIALTANEMKADEDKCRAAGMDDYLSKPIDIELFKTTLIQYLV